MNLLECAMCVNVCVAFKSNFHTQAPTSYEHEYVDFSLLPSLSFARRWLAGWHFIPVVGNLNECDAGTLFDSNEYVSARCVCSAHCVHVFCVCDVHLAMACARVNMCTTSRETCLHLLLLLLLLAEFAVAQNVYEIPTPHRQRLKQK